MTSARRGEGKAATCQSGGVEGREGMGGKIRSFKEGNLSARMIYVKVGDGKRGREGRNYVKGESWREGLEKRKIKKWNI